ncbi:DUF4124 domain-containing protein [Pseudomonas huanghezhanensis]|uniref:DUF4124 domain-containing protein n=1 Tax=Pseudomonas huanghezhanensis TaxID=3002903 RepID=UPI002285549C|nr:DUF4124 domain-containing protein [Pseudomonas sp. BSw22131]
MRWMILAAALTLGVSPMTQAAQIYKWVDAQGVTHFDALPPADQQAQEIDTQKPVPPPGRETAPLPDPNGAQRAINERVKKQVADQEERRAEYCTAARTNLALFQNNARVREQVNGEYRRFTEEERQARIMDLKRAITDNCL